MSFLARILNADDALSSMRLVMLMIVTTDCLVTLLAALSMAWHGQEFGMPFWLHLTADMGAVLALKGWQKQRENPSTPPTQ